jgi:hypothetical protein
MVDTHAASLCILPARLVRVGLGGGPEPNLEKTMRQLLQSEVKTLRLAIGEQWGWTGHYWIPLSGAFREDVIAFDTKQLAPVLLEERFRSVLKLVALSTVFWLREIDPSEKTTIDEIPFFYGNSEACITDTSNRWIIYFSHEETIALGGTELIGLVKQSVPEWTEIRYTYGN